MKIAVYNQLLEGGALNFWAQLIVLMKKKYEVVQFEEKKVKFRNFIDYLVYVYIKLPKVHKTLSKQIKKSKPDIVLLTHNYLTKSPYLLRYVNKSIYLCHEEPREFYKDYKYLSSSLKLKVINFIRLPLKYVDRINTSFADIVLANSQFSKDKLKKIYQRQINILPMALSPKFRSLSIEKNNQYVVVGATSIFKGMDFIIKSISILPKELKYPLIIVGNRGRDHKYLMKLAKSLNVKIIHLSNISNSKIVEIYNTSKLLFAAAHNEPFGLSVIEALACGLPVIAINEGGYRETIDNYIIKNKYGMLVNRDVCQFADTVIYMLNQKRVKDKQIENYVMKKYSWDNTMKHLDKIINSI